MNLRDRSYVGKDRKQAYTIKVVRLHLYVLIQSASFQTSLHLDFICFPPKSIVDHYHQSSRLGKFGQVYLPSRTS